MKKLTVLVFGLIALAACDNPAKTDASVTPAAPVAAPAEVPLQFPSSYLGKTAASFLPAGNVDPKTLCVGVVDTAAKNASGIALGGWAWNLDKAVAFENFLVADSTGTFIGTGYGGIPRPDVQKVIKEATSPNVGWNATGPAATGQVEVFGLDPSGKTVCSIGKAQIPAA